MNNRQSNDVRSSSGDTNWYTPLWIIDLAKQVMGGIALDPASCAEANEVVKADFIYNIHDDGLALPWLAGTVFCNPPYGKGDVTGKWWRKMWTEYEAGNFAQGMFLANATMETKWMQHALGHCVVLLIAGRVKFWKPGLATRNGQLGSALVYLPPRHDDPPRPLGVPLGAPLYVPLYAEAVRRFADAAGGRGVVITSL